MWTGESKTEMQMVKNQHSGMTFLRKSYGDEIFFSFLRALTGELVINFIDDIFSCSRDCRMALTHPCSAAVLAMAAVSGEQPRE